MSEKETLQDIQDYLNHDFVIVKKKKQRTEQEILKEFEKFGYIDIYDNKPYFIEMEKDKVWLIIEMEKDKCVYKYYGCGLECYVEKITLEELKLLNELFEIWGWL